MVSFAAELLDRVGLLGVALLIAAESIFPPIPSELVLLLTGFNVSEQRFALVPAITLATAGSVLGAWLLYALGAWIDETRMTRVLGRVGRLAGVGGPAVARAFDRFARHGSWFVFVGRLVPVVRSVVSVPAGATRMALGRFTVLTAAGSALWNTGWIVAGRALGEQWTRAHHVSEIVELVVLGAAALVVVATVARPRLARRKRLRAAR